MLAGEQVRLHFSSSRGGPCRRDDCGLRRRRQARGAGTDARCRFPANALQRPLRDDQLVKLAA